MQRVTRTDHTGRGVWRLAHPEGALGFWGGEVNMHRTEMRSGFHAHVPCTAAARCSRCCWAWLYAPLPWAWLHVAVGIAWLYTPAKRRPVLCPWSGSLGTQTARIDSALALTLASLNPYSLSTRFQHTQGA